MANLIVEDVYLYPKENSELHKTNSFDIVNESDNPIAVFRRGLKFTLAISFANRAYTPKDNVLLVFSFGPKPNILKGTKVNLKVDPGKKRVAYNKFWTVRILSREETTLTLEVYSPPTIPIGIWNLQIESNLINSTSEPTIYNYTNDIYFLFNPWATHDSVYMHDKRLLDEYILTDIGKIWVGPHTSCKGREWVFGQFDLCILPATMLMFERSKILPERRGDPIEVCRVISKLVNSNDDDGILVGRWDGEYDDGTSPSAWTGSIDILQEFLDTQKPVCYGQCWVFAGVVTTICRALGIPSRVVSNLVSAHDSNASLTIDKYYDNSNKEISDPRNSDGPDDSIWNYHVWNEVWMARPDLPAGFGGWQAIDATPQETSDSFYQCGPASLESIKQGQIGFKYDVGFMIATVNADLFLWKEDPDSETKLTRFYYSKYHIGRMILTKQPFFYDYNGDKDRMDITNLYKPKEGTEAERLAFLNAIRGSKVSNNFYEACSNELYDVEFDLVELEFINIGDNFSLVVKIKNNSDEVRTIESVLSVCSIYYTGQKGHLVKKAKAKFKLQPNSDEKITLVIKADEYLDKLVEYCNMKLYAVASVIETKQTWAEEDDFQVLKPNIKISIPNEIPEKVSTKIALEFLNPLKKTLTNCYFSVSSPGFVKNLKIKYPDVPPKTPIRTEFDIKAEQIGEKKLVVTFSSKELCDISGSAKVDVVSREEYGLI